MADCQHRTAEEGYLVNFVKFDERFAKLLQPPMGHGHLRLKPHTLHLIHRLQRVKTLLKYVCVCVCVCERERERERVSVICMAKAYIRTLVKRPAVSTALSISSTLKRYLTHLQLTYLSAVSSVLASSIHLAASFRSPACYADTKYHRILLSRYDR